MIRTFTFSSALAGCLMWSSVWADTPTAASHETRVVPGAAVYVAAAGPSGGASASQSGVAASNSALPPVQQVNGVSYINGGFGLDESNAMMAAIPQHSIAMIFSEANGAYVANVSLRITGTNGGANVELNSVGPILLMDLPDGQYTATASFQGRDLTRRFSIRGGKGQRIGFAW